MGLEAVPVPVRGGPRRRKASGMPAAACGGGVRKQRLRRTGQEELAFQKGRLFMELNGYDDLGSGTCQAGALLSGVGPDVSGVGRDGNGWEFRLRR
uniref:Uncharacterized protein n=1 Tax=Arundo donax TaxID=35708 RepID=A0A0A9BS80_ARUDO